MSVRLVVKNSLPASASPYRLLDDRGSEVAWANQFLDAQKVRQLSLRSLRAYAYDLLHLARWFKNTRHSLGRLNQSLLLEYVRHQLEQRPSPTPQTINHRLCALRCLYRFHYAQEIPGKPLFQRRYTTRSSLGYGRRQTKITTNLRLRQPRRVIVPLSADQVARFWKGFRTFRDLAIVALMLQNGLRSCEVLQLQLEDLRLSEARLHVLGKGRKQRFLPLTADTLQVLQNYLHLTRPLCLFLLKAQRRGHSMTVAGLRSLFRHHRCPNLNSNRNRKTSLTFRMDDLLAGTLFSLWMEFNAG
jgi:site-specific recombinase XerD